MRYLSSCLCVCALLLGCDDTVHQTGTALDVSAMTDVVAPPMDEGAIDEALPDESEADAASIYEAQPGPIAASPQRPGDPERGYHALVNAPYVTCGVPARIYNQFQGPAPAQLQLPGREGVNERRAFFETEFTNEDGLQIVSTNCLTCHVGVVNNQLFVGPQTQN